MLAAKLEEILVEVLLHESMMQRVFVCLCLRAVPQPDNSSHCEPRDPYVRRSPSVCVRMCVIVNAHTLTNHITPTFFAHYFISNSICSILDVNRSSNSAFTPEEE